MSENPSVWLVWTRSPFALTIAVAIAIGMMYLGRASAHAALGALSGALRALLARSSELVSRAQERLALRNREVLLEAGREATAHAIEREFERVSAVVAGDLSGYPALHRKLADQIARIDEDYRASTEVPPAPPEWARVVEAVASVPPSGDTLVSRILEDIEKSLERAQKRAVGAYRRASGERHRLLHKMLPFWRRLERTLQRVEGTIGGLNERARVLDQQMERYEQINAGSDRAVRSLAASSMTQFAASAFVLVIAVLGGLINFHLIALPMSEMVGATSYVGPVKTSDIAALVIIMTEIAMGLFLMESLRITRLFPVVHALDDRMRVRMIWVSFGILLTLACVESSLAYMRDLLAADREALTQQLAGVQAPETALRWIPSVGQMVMGFMLPFALTFAAVPLESFLQSSRVVLGGVMELTLRGLAAGLDLLAGFVENLGAVSIHLYDFAIVVPLRIEAMVLKRQREQGLSDPHPALRRSDVG